MDGDNSSADLAAKLEYSLARLSGLAVSCREECEALRKFDSLEILLQDTFQERAPPVPATLSTVGLLLDGCTVADMIPGAPARSSGKIDKGDMILEVNGQRATSGNVAALIHGDDLPGSQLALRLRQQEGGHPRDITLTRMSAGRAVRLKALHDLLVSLRIHLRGQGDSAGEDIVLAIGETWDLIAHEWYQNEHAAGRKVSEMKNENSLRLEQIKTMLAEISRGLSDTNLQTLALLRLCDRDANQLSACSLKLTNAREDLVTASNTMEELRSQLVDQQDRSEHFLAETREARDRSLAEERETSKRVLAEEREAALQEQRRAGQMMEQLREALACLRREHHGKKEECARSQEQLDRLIAVGARNDSLVATLQGKLSALEKDGQPKANAGIGVVCDPHADGLKIRSLVPGGAASNQGILKPDDIILTVDGTKFRDAEHAFGLVQGIDGSSLVMEARRPSTSELIHTTLIRKKHTKPSREARHAPSETGDEDPIIQALREVSRSAGGLAWATSPALPLAPSVAVARPVQRSVSPAPGVPRAVQGLTARQPNLAARRWNLRLTPEFVSA